MASILVLMISAVGAADSNPFSIRSLYDPVSRVPGALIPFLVSGAPGESFDILGTEIQASDPVDCRAMRDPYRAQIILVKCKGETFITITISIRQGTQGYRLIYGPLEVKNFDDSLVPIDPDPPPEDPNILRGKQLYTSYCVDCHRPASDLRLKTAAQIQQAVNSQVKMNFLKTILTTGDYKALEAYFESIK